MFFCWIIKISFSKKLYVSDLYQKKYFWAFVSTNIITVLTLNLSPTFFPCSLRYKKNFQLRNLKTIFFRFFHNKFFYILWSMEKSEWEKLFLKRLYDSYLVVMEYTEIKYNNFIGYNHTKIEDWLFSHFF